MAECPYCSGPIEQGDRYCPRCGERQTDLEPRAGFLDPEVVQYLDGVRNGARTFDPDSPYHDRFEEQLAAAIGDFSHLAGVEFDLRPVLDLEDLPTDRQPVDPATEADDGTRQLLGLAVLLGLVADAFPETGVDELLAYDRQLRERR